jgi:hypothetical protein
VRLSDLLIENVHGDYNASGYPEDRWMAGDLAAEHSLAISVDVNCLRCQAQGQARQVGAIR